MAGTQSLVCLTPDSLTPPEHTLSINQGPRENNSISMTNQGIHSFPIRINHSVVNKGNPSNHISENHSLDQ